MSWMECLKFQHESYDMLGQRYGIPRDTCSARQLMDKAMDDSSILLRKRRVPVNQYYSMLMVDTPGYIPSPNWNKTGESNRQGETKIAHAQAAQRRIHSNTHPTTDWKGKVCGL